MNRLEAVETVQTWLMDLSAAPSGIEKEFTKEDMPYVIWALEQILSILRLCDDILMMQGVEDFRDTMYDFAWDGGIKSKHIFATVAYTADLAIYLLTEDS